MLRLVHRARVPHVAPGERLPAVVMVHGWQGNERVMGIFERTVPAGVVIVSPRAPVEADGEGFGWLRLDGGEGAFQAGLEALRDFIVALPQSYPIDEQRMLLMGFSQGAAMCYAAILAEPGLALGVAGLAGFLPDPARRWVAPGRLTGKPIFIAHGTADETLPIERARAARDALAEAGATLEFHEYPVGHKLNARGVHDLTQWLKARLGKGPA